MRFTREQVRRTQTERRWVRNHPCHRSQWTPKKNRDIIGPTNADALGFPADDVKSDLHLSAMSNMPRTADVHQLLPDISGPSLEPNDRSLLDE